MNILVIASELTDSRAWRRKAGFESCGHAVTLCGYNRARPDSEKLIKGPCYNLGSLSDGLSVRRLVQMPKALYTILRISRKHRIDCFYAINSDNGLLAAAANLLIKRAHVICELGDVQPAFTKANLLGILARFFEKAVYSRADVVVTTSPGFVREYLNMRLKFEGRVFLVENRIFPPVPRIRRSSPVSDPTALTIGWFGGIRCAQSLQILARMKRYSGRNIRIIVRGYPTNGTGPLFRQLVAAGVIEYGGVYTYPDDLEKIYGLVDLMWGIDFSAPGKNSAWLLPNRIYECALCDVPVLAVEETETGEWVKKHGSGIAIKSVGFEENLQEALQRLTPEDMASIRKRIRSLPDEVIIGGNEYQILDRALRGFKRDQVNYQLADSALSREARQVPVLIVGFKRASHIQQQIEHLNNLGIERIYVWLDGPRNEEEAIRTDEARAVVSRYRGILIKVNLCDSNLGCRKSVASAISWFFTEVNFGIILEEDVRISPDFFEICAHLGPSYADDSATMGINAFFPDPSPALWRAYIHKTNVILPWGWATWRRAWHHFDPEMLRWKSLRLRDRLELAKARTGSTLGYFYFACVFRLVDQGKISSWAFPWLLSVWTAGGHFLSPSFNLAKNVGFDSDATNTSKEGARFVNIPVAGKTKVFMSCADALEVSIRRDSRLLKFYFRMTSPLRLIRLFGSLFVSANVFLAVRRVFR